jgi:hypothetical protein
MLNRPQQLRLAKRVKKGMKRIPEDLIGYWVAAFAQGRGERGFSEAEVMKLTHLCAVLYQVMGMSRAQLEGFCRDTGARTDLDGLDDYLAYLDATFAQMNRLGVGEGPTQSQQRQRQGRLPSLQQLADL